MNRNAAKSGVVEGTVVGRRTCQTGGLVGAGKTVVGTVNAEVESEVGKPANRTGIAAEETGVEQEASHAGSAFT